MQCFLQNKKTFNLGPKVPYLVILQIKVGKTSLIYEICTLELVHMQSFLQN